LILKLKYSLKIFISFPADYLKLIYFSRSSSRKSALLGAESESVEQKLHGNCE
jgi:hypothetical protein